MSQKYIYILFYLQIESNRRYWYRCNSIPYEFNKIILYWNYKIEWKKGFMRYTFDLGYGLDRTVFTL